MSPKRILSLLSVIFSITYQYSFAQTLVNLQTGAIGTYANIDYSFTPKILVRTELGMDVGWIGGSMNGGTHTVFQPVFSLEPRLYSHFYKGNNENGAFNGNFIALKTAYRPGNWVISTSNRIFDHSIAFTPTLGIRRPLGKFFHYEFGLGLGYAYVFNDFGDHEWQGTANLLLRIGYRF